MQDPTNPAPRGAPAWTLTHDHANAVLNAALAGTPCTCGNPGAEATGHRADCTYRLVLESSQILSMILQPRATLYGDHASLAEMVSAHIDSFRALIKSARAGDESDQGFIDHELAALTDIEVACRADLNTASAIGIAAGGVPMTEPIAHVPVHPRTGPLWANTVESLEKGDRPKSYPTLPLYADTRSARTHAVRSWRDQIVTATYAHSMGDLSVALQRIVDDMTESIDASMSFASTAQVGPIDRELVVVVAGEHDVPLTSTGGKPQLDERIVALALDIATRAAAHGASQRGTA
ncbi:hypothetical protein [Burkholderia sp. Ac-20365]|uniref:hypothetical protein n=1 Tax=Burkholderia sp. Ac-20365 TaxID=2703897 RepID=UPI00197B53EE|nr:hypothetical protein [Burkholderia sp. Ac-20365]MBN3761160.1 hypothetical protein [Burkholderia sp. Ac-20365]